jgi:hypothetical protein
MKAKRKQRAVKVYGVWYADGYRNVRMSLSGTLHRTPAGAVAHAKLLIRAKLSSDYRWRRERKSKVPTNVYARWFAYDPRTGERRLPYQPVVIRVHDLVR